LTAERKLYMVGSWDVASFGRGAPSQIC
jgi:hypothetical protein